jgi:hypothetical protein
MGLPSFIHVVYKHSKKVFALFSESVNARPEAGEKIFRFLYHLFLNLFGFVSCFFQKGSANERETVCGESHERSTGLEPEIAVFRGCSFRLAKPNF